MLSTLQDSTSQKEYRYQVNLVAEPKFEVSAMEAWVARVESATNMEIPEYDYRSDGSVILHFLVKSNYNDEVIMQDNLSCIISQFGNIISTQFIELSDC